MEYLNNLFSFVENHYLRAALVFALFYMISQICVYVIEKFLMKLAKKTETEADDLILEAINKPISFILILVGLLLGVKMVNFSVEVGNLVQMSINALIILIFTFISAKVITILINVWGYNLAKKTESTADDQLIRLLDRFSSIFIWVIGIMFVFQTWGIQIMPLLASLGIAGVAIAFALQSSLGNIFGGISLIIDKSVKVGDVIELDADTKGTVLDVGIRSTKIRTWNNEVLIVPSGKLADSKIINYAQPSDIVRVVVPFGVEYGSDIDKVKKLVLKLLPKVEGFISDPGPYVMFLEMGDSSLKFNAYFFVSSYSQRFSALNQANTFIYNALNKAKIGIPFPQMDVHMKK